MESDIKIFLNSRIIEKRKVKTPNFEVEKHCNRFRNKWTSVSEENLRAWLVVLKWIRLAYEQMLSYTRTTD